MAPPIHIYPGRGKVMSRRALRVEFSLFGVYPTSLDIGSGLAFADATAIRRQTSRREIAFSVLQMPYFLLFHNLLLNC